MVVELVCANWENLVSDHTSSCHVNLSRPANACVNSSVELHPRNVNLGILIAFWSLKTCVILKSCWTSQVGIPSSVIDQRWSYKQAVQTGLIPKAFSGVVSVQELVSLKSKLCRWDWYKWWEEKSLKSVEPLQQSSTSNWESYPRDYMPTYIMHFLQDW